MIDTFFADAMPAQNSDVRLDPSSFDCSNKKEIRFWSCKGLRRNFKKDLPKVNLHPRDKQNYTASLLRGCFRGKCENLYQNQNFDLLI